jgi:vacuolar-type H+-ATPase subunit I/STV1
MNIFRKNEKKEIIFSLKQFNALRYDAKKELAKLPDDMREDNRQEFIEALGKRIAIYESYIFNVASLMKCREIKDIVNNSASCAKRAQQTCIKLKSKLEKKNTTESDLYEIQFETNMKGLRITHDMVEEFMDEYHIKPSEVDYRGRI